MTKHASTFAATDALQAYCDRLPAGADIRDVEALAARVLDPSSGVAVRIIDAHVRTSGEVIRRADGRLVPVGDAVPYSTPELLSLEADTLTRALARQHSGVAAVDADTPSRELDMRPLLSAEQRHMVTTVTTSGAGVDVVVGKAVSGKTYALDAARAARHTSSYTVIGCALAARAAAELEAGAGTLDALVVDLDRAGADRWLDRSTVVVVDEAAMVGTRKLAALGHAETAGAKLVGRR